MATSTESTTSRQYVDFDEYIDFQLQKTRTQIKWTDVLTACAGAATFLLAYLLVFTILDQWIISGGFGTVARTLMFTAVVLLCVGWIAWKIVVPYLKNVTRLYAARQIEKSHPELKSTLLNLVDLQGAGRRVPEPIRGALEKRAAVSLSQMDLEQVVDRRPLMRFAYVLLALVVLICLYTVFSPKQVSFARALLPASKVAVPTQTEIFDVSPGDVEVLAREQLEVVAELRGQIPEQVTLLFTTADRKFVDETIDMRELEDGRRRYRAILNGENGRGILQNMTYRIVAGDAQSEDYAVTVMQPPSATVTDVRYEFPSYMELPPETRSGGHIDAWEGTEVTVTAKTNMPVESARLLFSDTEDVDARAEEAIVGITDGNTLTARWKLEFRSDGTFPKFYRIQCKNEAGQSDPEPTLYSINIRPDEPPDILLVDPVRDLQRPANAVIPLMLQARDPDFRLRYLRLHIEKNGEEIEGPYIYEGRRQNIGLTYDWELAPLGLKAGDTITFWVEARDNRQPLGNRKNTPRLNVQITESASPDEVEQQRQADRKRQQQMMDNADGNEEGEEDSERLPENAAGENPEDQQDNAAEQPPADEQNQNQPGDDGTGENQPQAGEPDENSEGGQGSERLDPDGGDDAEVMKKLLDNQQQQPPEDQAGQPDAQPQEGQQNDQPSDKQSGKQQNDRSEPGMKSPGEPGGDPQDAQPPDSSSAGEGGETGENRGGRDQGSDPSQPQPKAGEPSPDAGQIGDSTGQSQNQPANPTDGGKPSGGQPSPDDSQSEDDGKGELRDKPDDGGAGGERQMTDEQRDGTARPTDEDDNARREKATGDESGEGRPDDDPNADPTGAKNDITRKEGEKPSPTDEPGRNKPAPGGDNPENVDPSKLGEKSDQTNPDQRPSDSREADPSRPPAKTDEQENMENEDLKGPGRPEGQKSENPDGGEQGSSKQSDQGTQGGKDEGAGDSTGQPGTQEEGKPNQPQPGEPSEGQPGEGQESTNPPNNEAAKPGGDGQAAGEKKDGPQEGRGTGETEGARSDVPADGEGAKSAGKAGAESEMPPSGSANGGPAGGNNAGSGSGDSNSAPPPEDPNLEYAKEATNLVLKKLGEELKRGEVDQELLDELGWNENDLKKFVDRMQRQLDDTGQDPESIARRRQLEEMLKSVTQKNKGVARQGRSDRDSSSGGIGPRRVPVPAEYRSIWEEYTRSLSKRTGKRE